VPILLQMTLHLYPTNRNPQFWTFPRKSRDLPRNHTILPKRFPQPTSKEPHKTSSRTTWRPLPALLCLTWLFHIWFHYWMLHLWTKMNSLTSSVLTKIKWNRYQASLPWWMMMKRWIHSWRNARTFSKKCAWSSSDTTLQTGFTTAKSWNTKRFCLRTDYFFKEEFKTPTQMSEFWEITGLESENPKTKKKGKKFVNFHVWFENFY